MDGQEGPIGSSAITDLTPMTPPTIVRRIRWRNDLSGGAFLENSMVIVLAEAMLRVILGWRMLISGLSNVRRWPNPVTTASILFPRGATFFGFVATFLMVVGGFGLAVGIQTPISAVMIVIFLILPFVFYWNWLEVLFCI